MAGLILRWIGNSLAIYMVAALFVRMRVDSVQDALLAGAVLGIVNTIVRPILVVLTLPVTVLTLGLFYFVISAFCLWLTSYLLDGFEVGGVFTTLVAAVLVSVISTVITSWLHRASGTRGRGSR